MFEQHKEAMMKFMILNQEYKNDKLKYREQFHCEGEKIKEIIEQYIDKLCKQMEGGKYGTYSNKLADKFIEEVTKYFPMYHEIGVNVK